jgi:chaperone BCS1
MTTNCPETLDAALIRPGRVDLQIKFTLATQDQIRDIYMKMYKVNGNMKNRTQTDHPTACNNNSSEYSHMDGNNLVQCTELEDMATQFACNIPSGVFSQAEIQGLLLKWRTDPEGVLKDVETWKVEQLKAKKVGRNQASG